MRRALCRLALVLTAVVAAGSVVTVTPVRADEGGAHCDPGSNCTGFERNAYEVTEGTAHVDLAVYAAWCCPVGQGAIDYETVDRSAVAGEDYQRTSGTLTYTGHGGARIRVPISDDALSEGAEQFEVRLTNFRGTFVNRGYETAVVTIVDPTRYEHVVGSTSVDDTNQGTPDPLQTASAPRRPPAAAIPAPDSMEAWPASPVQQHRPPEQTEGAIARPPGAEKASEGGPSSGLLVAFGCALLATVVVGSSPFRRARRA